MAYTKTLTLDFPYAQKVNRYLWMITGKCDVTVYDQTGVEITGITGVFTKLLRVVCDGVSDNMYLMRWNTTDKCFHAFYPFYASAGSETAGANNTLCKTSTAGPSEVAGSGAAYGQPGVEVANSVDVGEVNFVAYGSR